MAPQTSDLKEAAPVVMEKDGAKVMRLEVPLNGLSCDDVMVRPDDKRLLILHKADAALIRAFDLPESVDPFTIEAELLDGVLFVEAPVKC
nr:small heat shock protein [Eunice torquata]